MHHDDSTLLDCAKAARLVQEFIADQVKDDFLKDYKTQSSVLYQLIVLGEAVKRLSQGFRAKHTEIPWTLIAGMRDHLIRGYDVVDWEEVWKTAKHDIPDLLTNMEPLLPDIPQ
ncbi:MAG: HepT-like ribonuclease domain-containing protein [bacterium]